MICSDRAMIPQAVELQQDPLVSGACEVNNVDQSPGQRSQILVGRLNDRAVESEESDGEDSGVSHADLTELMRLAYVKRPRNLEKHIPNGRCDFCGTDATPMWRRGPKGCSTLCNACGVKWKNALIRAGILPPKGRLPKTPKFVPKKFSSGLLDSRFRKNPII